MIFVNIDKAIKENKAWNNPKDGRTYIYAKTRAIAIKEIKTAQANGWIKDEATPEEIAEKYLNDDGTFYRKGPDKRVWWKHNDDTIGVHEFSFDRKKVYNLFRDYPWALSAEEQIIFDQDEEFWADFFADRRGKEPKNKPELVDIKIDF